MAHNGIAPFGRKSQSLAVLRAQAAAMVHGYQGDYPGGHHVGGVDEYGGANAPAMPYGSSPERLRR